MQVAPDESRLRKCKETQQQREAYLCYYAMGSKRNYRAVAQKTGVTIGTLSNWSKKFDWVGRLEEASSGIVDRMQRRIQGDMIKKTAQFKAECMNMLDVALEDAMERISSGDLRIDSVKDLVSVVKTSLLLRGEVTERRETKKSDVAEKAKKILDLVNIGGTGPFVLPSVAGEDDGETVYVRDVEEDAANDESS